MKTDMHSRSKRAIALLALILVPAAAFAATPSLAPGLWQVTSKSAMVGMPVNMPARTTKVCLTAAQLAEPWKQFEAAAKQQGCTISDMSVDAHSAHWKLKCKGSDGMSGSGSSQFADAHQFKGRTTLRMTESGQTMHMVFTNEGHWLSASCGN
jgi:hypothetical protein